MFDPEARQEITTTSASSPCTFVIELSEHPDEAIFAFGSKRERLERLVDFYRTVKAPLIDELSSEGVSVKDLPTSSQIIATTTAAKWRELVPQLDTNPNVKVLPNRLYHAI
jgi:hypothetical protein